MNEKTCPTCAYCGPDTDEPICHRRLSTNLSPCESWEPRGFDYDRMAAKALSECKNLEQRIEVVQAEQGGTADDKMNRKRRLNLLRLEHMEQKSIFRELARKAEERRQA